MLIMLMLMLMLIVLIITIAIIMILIYGSALMAGGFSDHPTSLPSQPCVFIFMFEGLIFIFAFLAE